MKNSVENNKIDFSYFLEKKDLLTVIRDAFDEDVKVTDDQLRKFIEISEKVHNDPSYNLYEDLTEEDIKVFEDIIGIDKNDQDFKDLLLDQIRSFKDLKELEEQRTVVGNEVSNLAEKSKEFLEDIKKKETEYRNMMEVSYIEKANETEDPEEKQRLLDTSFAYTDGYKLTRLSEFMNSDIFNKNYKKYKKRFNVLCSDFDYLVQKVTNSYEKNTKLSYMRKCMENRATLVSFENDDIDRFCVALGLLARYGIDKNYKPDIWLLYCICSNMIRVCTIKKCFTDFDKERIEYLVKFFNK